jgi:hypothetical protein
MKFAVFWVVIPCSSEIDWHFGGIIIDLWDNRDWEDEDSLFLISKGTWEHFSVWLCTA